MHDLEVWVDDEGNELTVQWNEDFTYCFFKQNPRRNPDTRWDGFTSIGNLVSKGYRYEKSL